MKKTTLKSFVSDMKRRADLAAATDSSPDYLWQLGVKFQGKRPSTKLAQKIERESARIWRVVPKESLRPDVWTDNQSSH